MLERQALVVAGGFGIDTNVYLVGARSGAETTFARTTDGLGQAGCYSALTSSALGVPTRALAALGDDRFGAWVREELEAADVEVTELRDPGGTHRSVNLVDETGSRRNYFDARGAGAVFVETQVATEVMRGALALHCHLDDWCRQLLPIARHLGLLISCDLQDVIDLDDPYRADFVAAADLLFLSAVNLDDPERAAMELAQRRQGRIVVVGDGAAGCLVAAGGGVRRQPAATLDGPVVDTNGAGDALAVGFLVGHVFDGLPLERSARRAQLGARWICSQHGDHKAPITRSALDRLEAVSQG